MKFRQRAKIIFLRKNNRFEISKAFRVHKKFKIYSTQTETMTQRIFIYQHGKKNHKNTQIKITRVFRFHKFKH